MSREKRFLVLTSFLVVLFLGSILLSRVFDPDSHVQAPAVVEAVFEDFEIASHDGSSASFSEYLEEPALVFFWTTWCSFCKLQLEDLLEVYETDNANILLVNLPTFGNNRNELSDARAFVTEEALPFQSIYDVNGTAMRTFQITAVPMTMFWDGSAFTHRQLGYMDADAMRVQLP